MNRIPIAGPWITEKEIAYVSDAAATAWYGQANKYHEHFEKAFADYLGVRFCVALPSCTSAIHLSLLAFNTGPGDEVIVPDATWIASSAPISYVGATPVFCDVDSQTWCLNAASFESCITPRTKAVIAVDLYGGMPDYEAIGRIAARHNIAIIEDAAEAIGSEHKGRRAGSLGRTGVFSFHGSKTLTTGEGGLLATDDEAIYRRVLFLRDHGRAPGDVQFFNTEVAYKYKMSAMQAAMGLAQLERIEELVERKRQIFEWYREELQDLSEITLNFEPPNTKNSYWMVTALFDKATGLDKTVVMEFLKERAIDSRPFFHPLSALPAYAGLPSAQEAQKRNRVAYDLGVRGVNLPSALCLIREQVQRVCSVLRELIAQ
ncbi:MAG TPA: DegT/DnrJ/EryC1/StrS family aminotransferase [Abditibacteriaceae bacterium]|jgi:perosamine synthetase